MILTNPSVCPAAWALPDAWNGNVPTLYAMDFSLQARSVRPMLATCGWQYVQPGIAS